MGTRDELKKLKKAAADLGRAAAKDVGGAANRAVDRVTEVAATVEQGVADGSLERRMKSGVKDAHARVVAQGGYVAAGRAALRGVSDVAGAVLHDANSALDAIAARLGDQYQRLDDAFYTGGQFDRGKADAYLRNKAAIVRQVGAETYSALEKLARSTAADVNARRNDLLVTKADLRGRFTTEYGVVGERYQGVALRPRLNASLAFLREAETKIPAGKPYRRQILKDIAAGAITTVGELPAHYSRTKDEAGARKLAQVDRYLRSGASGASGAPAAPSP